MLRQFAFLVPVFVAGLILGAWAWEADPAVAPQSARDFDHAADYQRLERMISSLTEIVNLEVAERRRLEEQIAALADEFAVLNGKAAQQRDESAAQIRSAEATRKEAARSSRGRTQEVNVDRFVEAGFAPDVASRLKNDMDQIALARLYLRDQAVREGWLNSTRYRAELRTLNERQNGIREDLSPEDYDRYLYALGRPNRITINSVLSGSPADVSGLHAGDAIISYDSNRVFSPSEIRRETSRGAAGSVVPVEILRNGQIQIVYLPRGPLGVNMAATSTKP